jgi:hypothetical protein
MPWARRQTYRVAGNTSSTETYEMNDYSLGMNSFFANDKFPFRTGQNKRLIGPNYWRLAQDARIITFGDYETRKGFDFHSEAAGQAQDQAITAITGAANQSFSGVTRLAQKFTAASSGKLTRLDVNIANDASATGTIIIALYSDSGGSPSSLLGYSSIAASTPTASLAYLTIRFANPPTVTAGSVYWVVQYSQSGTGSYKWSSTTSATTAKVSTDSGMTWSTTTYALNFKQYYAPSGAVKGLFRATKTDGTKVTLMAQGTTLYSVDNVTGALTAIKTGLSASATLYRFQMANDIVYYVNSYDGYRKWDFTTESQVNATNYSDLVLHKGLMFLVRVDDPNRYDWSNFGIYETFTSTDFEEVPAPKTGDPIASIISINGYLLVRTQNHCYIFSGEDNATFRLDDAPDQKGTFGPLTACADKNYTYFLSNDGVYKSNGTQPTLISENIYTDIQTLANKPNTCIAINKGRLYLWYASAGSSVNDSCYVWNLNFNGGTETIESKDTDAYVSMAVSSFRDSDNMLVGSSVVGQVHWQELASNDFNNLGGPINYMLQQHYIVGDSPSLLKENRYWQVRFGTQNGNYSVACEYAYDLRNNWQTVSNVAVQGTGPIWGSSTMVWGSFTWGSTAEVQASIYIPGEYRRLGVRFKHYAPREPHDFLGHSMVNQTRRRR